jgi:hypothetical protein
VLGKIKRNTFRVVDILAEILTAHFLNTNEKLMASGSWINLPV